MWGYSQFWTISNPIRYDRPAHILFSIKGVHSWSHSVWRYYLLFLQGYDIEQSWDTIQEKKVTACKCVFARHCKFTNWVNLLVTQHCKEVNTSCYNAQTLEVYYTGLCVQMAQIKLRLHDTSYGGTSDAGYYHWIRSTHYDEFLLPAELLSGWWSRSGLPLVTHRTDHCHNSVVWDTCTAPTATLILETQQRELAKHKPQFVGVQ